MAGRNYNEAVMAEVYAEMVNDEFRSKLEERLHNAVHAGVGGGRGDMGLQNASPNGKLDPLFFLHYAQTDRVWWMWQQKDPNNRTFAYN